VRQVLKGEAVPAGEKLLSLFEPHTQIIPRSKAGQAVEFGRKVGLDEDAGTPHRPGQAERLQLPDGQALGDAVGELLDVLPIPRGGAWSLVEWSEAHSRNSSRIAAPGGFLKSAGLTCRASSPRLAISS
jgi:hypothetical protein